MTHGCCRSPAKRTGSATDLQCAHLPAGGGGAGLFGGGVMLQLSSQSRIFLATEPVDFRTGIDGLAAVCCQALGDNPLRGAVYVCRHRAGTVLTLWLYDGQGYWIIWRCALPPSPLEP